MKCKYCGAEIGEGLRICLECGEEVEYTREQLDDEFSDGVVDEGYYDSDSAREVELQNDAEEKQETNKKMFGVILLALLIAAVVLGIVLAVMAKNNGGSLTGDDIADALTQNVSNSQVIAYQDDAQTAETTAAVVEETTTTTTTTTTEDPGAEAAALRSLLTSKTWATNIEGYDAEVKFKNDGTAVITAKIKVLGMTVKKDLDAKYSLTDDCIMTFGAEYGGKNYGVKGALVRNSDSELTLVRANNAGTISLKAVK